MSAHDEAVQAADARLHPGDWRRAADDKKKRPEMVAFIVRAYLAHIAAAEWKLTPREATEGMTTAGYRIEPVVDVWSAMHDAAPSPEEAP